MQLFARIEAGIVVERIELPDTRLVLKVDGEGNAILGEDGAFQYETHPLVLGDVFPPEVADAFVTCPDDVAQGWTYDGSTFAAPVPADPSSAPVPGSITPLQARNGLRAWGIGRAEITGFFATITSSTDREAAEDAWEYATTIERANPLIAACAAFLGKSAEDVDQFFRESVQL